MVRLQHEQRKEKLLMKNRIFEVDGLKSLLFVKVAAVCMVCDETVSVFKRMHCKTKHAS